ncbi:MAG TPA: DUF4288 domain-containing protein [Drouetiella sp.]|jgi:Domain of unknown function (DUF4288)
MTHQVTGSQSKEFWHAAKCVFLHAPGAEQLYEERVVLIAANDWNEAIEVAEREARDYAASLDHCTYIGFVSVFKILAESLCSETEVYSLMRASTLEKEEYLDRFYDTGSERTGKVES